MNKYPLHGSIFPTDLHGTHAATCDCVARLFFYGRKNNNRHGFPKH